MLQMKARKVIRNEHTRRAKTPASRSVFRDLLPAEKAAESAIRSTLLRGFSLWLANGEMTQIQAAEALGVTQARISDIKRGKINQFSLDLLIRLAAQAGLQPTLRLAA
jgi:predicted XRE-type DNA-binding protein